MSNSLWPHGLYSPPGSSVRGIFQAGILEWVAIPFSRGSSWPRDRIGVSRNADRYFTIWVTHTWSLFPPLTPMEGKKAAGWGKRGPQIVMNNSANPNGKFWVSSSHLLVEPHNGQKWPGPRSSHHTQTLTRGSPRRMYPEFEIWGVSSSITWILSADCTPSNWIVVLSWTETQMTPPWLPQIYALNF